MMTGLIAGILAGFSAHQIRDALEQHTPHILGAFPVVCYVVGGLVVVGIYDLIHGQRRAWDLFCVFAAVGLGVGGGMVYDHLDAGQ